MRGGATGLGRAEAFARRHASRFVQELVSLVGIPSISTDPARAGDVRTCALWLARDLRRIGMERVDLIRTPGHPVVLATWRRRPDRPTLLVYGHYDVQPVDPPSEWKYPPFRPVVRNGYLYGRGSSDDKGPLFAHVKALECALRTGGLPLNVVCVLEGEEEIGSPDLGQFLRSNGGALAADAVVVSDTRMLAPDRPTLTYSLRGGLGLELTMRGPRRDLHSGAFGGAVPNPAQAMCEVIASLHDRRGRIAVPGLYRRVREWGTAERAFMARTGPSDAEILRQARAGRGRGESRYSLYERTTIRPALAVNGIGGGYAGPGGKGVIPATAWAKVSLRLVADQEPKEVMRLVLARLRDLVPRGLTLTVRSGLAVRPVVIDRRHPAMDAAARAYVRGFGAAPVFVRSGGSISAVALFQQHLGLDTVLMGFALPEDGMHGPDERFLLANFHRGIRTSLAFMWELARTRVPGPSALVGRPGTGRPSA